MSLVLALTFKGRANYNRTYTNSTRPISSGCYWRSVSGGVLRYGDVLHGMLP